MADLLERRWTVSILVASNEGAQRFNEFLQMLGPVPPATLTSRLAELEAAGIFERVVVPSRPPRVEYHLTAFGRRFVEVLDQLEQLGKDFGG